ncbi:methylated-DNA--[protein]-cysteine S-methyltransferase [Weissella confusa]|uniref:methylated-DNA--[protein]-cysteine S-methyltransferase n=1 Tax=Weissella confusa TaxID=1583 RepID=A0A4Z0RTL8_WEICO|nr:methylated-DNA--[protein]-cysteine S-methyltransferase [Weissella confusa]TGE71118.1 methylated-DNA--[protein]-cysteine S-methyltransferase [Weissella confusa]
MQYETYDFLNGQLTIFYLEAGMTFVSLAGDPVADYQARFGKTQIAPSEEQRYATVVADYLAGRVVDFTPDWQGRGTALQHEVWSALAETNFGETLTYAALANRIGRPNAVRAVTSAVGKNPLLVFVGCHRVVRSDGTLGQYRAGQNWKQRVIDFERNLQ